MLGAPEPWEPADSLLWAKTMGLWLSMNWRQELSRQALAGKVPAATARSALAAAGRRAGPRRDAPPPTRFADGRVAPAAVLPRISGAVSPCRTARPTSGRWTAAYRDRRAAAGRRPASGVRLPGHLVPGADRHAGRRAGRRHRAGRAVPGDRPQRQDRLDLHHHRRRRAGHFHRNPGRRRLNTRRRTDRGRSRCGRNASTCAASPISC